MPSLFVMTLLVSPPAACERAFDAVAQVARREGSFGYAQEVTREGRRAFVAACVQHLSSRETRCILRARSSDELYVCTP
jgi:hypothetical protein